MKWVLFSICVGAVVCLGTVFGYLWWASLPVDIHDANLQTITVSKGETGTTIANALEAENLIRSALVLRLVLRQKDATAIIQAGTYQFSPSMRVGEVADVLLRGAKDNWITFLEGWRSEEYADQLATNFGLRYFDRDQFLQLASGKEGRLFPDTYLFPKQTSASTVIDTLVTTFEKKYQKLESELGSSSLTKEQVIVLASLVEREARDPQAMRIVAGILKNRLERDIPLQVDSTLQYAKGYSSENKTWWLAPRAVDKKLVSPFNTYTNKGLPPQAICNPGLNALRAAYAPQMTDYLFYLSDHKGVMHYAHTLEEHNANVEMYLK